jgi:hypothetical protein
MKMEVSLSINRTNLKIHHQQIMEVVPQAAMLKVIEKVLIDQLVQMREHKKISIILKPQEAVVLAEGVEQALKIEEVLVFIAKALETVAFIRTKTSHTTLLIKHRRSKRTFITRTPLVVIMMMSSKLIFIIKRMMLKMMNIMEQERMKKWKLSQIMDNSIKYNINSNSSKFFHIQKPRKC